MRTDADDSARIADAVLGPDDAGTKPLDDAVQVKGRKYVLTESEGAGGSPSGRCPAGWAQVVDVNDERNPAVISSFLLEVNRTENCAQIKPDHDGIPTTGPISILQNGIRYNSHYLGIYRALYRQQQEPRRHRCGCRLRHATLLRHGLP